MPVVARSSYMHFFNWGTHRPDGWWTLLLTFLAYAACVGVSLVLLRYVQRRGRPMLARVSGVVSLIPMLGLATESVLVQLMSRTDQEGTHALAVAATGTALLAVVCVSAFARVVQTRPQPQLQTEVGGATSSALD